MDFVRLDDRLRERLAGQIPIKILRKSKYLPLDEVKECIDDIPDCNRIDFFGDEYASLGWLCFPDYRFLDYIFDKTGKWPDDIAVIKDSRIASLNFGGRHYLPDLSHLSDLEHLRRLSISRYDEKSSKEAINLDFLLGLKKLESLDLSYMKIKDLSPLSGLDNLIYLNLSNTKVKDVSPLSGLKSLEWLKLNDTKIKNLAPLNNVITLKMIFLENTKVKDVSVLKGLSNLEYLEL